MGYIRHHMIVVTGWDEERVAAAHVKAREIFPTVSPVLQSELNGYESFFIPPDGSKEGCDASHEGGRRRNDFMSWCEAQYEPGYLDVVELLYGGDDWGVTAVRIAGNRRA